MSSIHAKNFIDGEWVAGADAAPEHQSVEHRRRGRRVSPARPRGGRRAPIAAAKAAFPAWSRSSIQTASRHPEKASATRSSPARTSSAACCRARKARRCPKASARPCAPARSSSSSPARPAPGRRDARLRAARRRRRDHARAGRRRRPDHAVELPDRHPGLEDRAGARLRQHAWCSSRPTWCRAAAQALVRDPRAAPACPTGVFNLVMGRGSVVGEAMLDAPGRRRDHLHRLGRRPAARSPQPASAPIR